MLRASLFSIPWRPRAAPAIVATRNRGRHRQMSPGSITSFFWPHLPEPLIFVPIVLHLQAAGQVPARRTARGEDTYPSCLPRSVIQQILLGFIAWDGHEVPRNLKVTPKGRGIWGRGLHCGWRLAPFPKSVGHTRSKLRLLPGHLPRGRVVVLPGFFSTFFQAGFLSLSGC